MSQFEEEGGLVDVEQRTKEVGKILNDPTLFPVEFLSWIKRFIEQSGIQLPVSSIIGTFTPGAGSLRPFPPGLILPFGGPSAPPGSLLCNGQSVARAEYDLLFAVIGVAFGSADGASFNVPDLRGRAPVGLGTHADVNAVGKADATALAQRRPKHQHTVYDPGHKHSVTARRGNSPNASTNAAGNFINLDTFDSGVSVTDVKVNPEGAATSPSPQDAPPYLVVGYVITAGA